MSKRLELKVTVDMGKLKHLREAEVTHIIRNMVRGSYWSTPNQVLKDVAATRPTVSIISSTSAATPTPKRAARKR